MSAREGLRIIMYAVPFPDVRRIARISVIRAVHAAYMRACIPRRQGRGSTVSHLGALALTIHDPQSKIHNNSIPRDVLMDFPEAVV